MQRVQGLGFSRGSAVTYEQALNGTTSLVEIHGLLCS